LQLVHVLAHHFQQSVLHLQRGNLKLLQVAHALHQ
jgi:hypothetical protein